MDGGAAISLCIAVIVAIAFLLLQPLLQITLNGVVVVLTLVVVAVILGAAVLIRSTRQRDDAVQAVLWATSPWLAGSLAVAIVALYLVGQTAVYAIAIGVLATAVAWLAIGFLFRRYATADTANPRNYAALLDRRSRLESDL